MGSLLDLDDLTERHPGARAELEALRKAAESLRHIAAIAHCGGLCGLSEAGTLTAIRRISLVAWDKSGSEEHMRRKVNAALLAAAVGAS